MKNSEIATLILIASVSIMIAYFVADGLIGQPTSASVKSKTVQTIDPMTADVVTPDNTIFNKDAINPTVEVFIGDQ